MENANKKLKLKLIIEKKSNKVLFGEARKDFVDLMFSLLALPLGAFTKLLTKDALVGSIGEVYDSLSKINGIYILFAGKVSSLLNPPLATTTYPSTNFFLPQLAYQDTKDRYKLYLCSSTTYSESMFCCPYVSLVEGVTCPGCGMGMKKVANFVNPKCDASTVVKVGNKGKGYVTGEVTYSVMDDLTMVPMSTTSSIALLNKFEIKDLESIEEITVSVGFEEGLKLLKASLETKTVLTDVFLKGNRAANA